MSRLPENFFRILWKSISLVVLFGVSLFVTLSVIGGLISGKSLADEFILFATMMSCILIGFMTFFLLLVLSIPLTLFWLWPVMRPWMSIPWKAGLIGLGFSAVYGGIQLIIELTSQSTSPSAFHVDYIGRIVFAFYLMIASFSYSFLISFFIDKRLKKQAFEKEQQTWVP